MHNERYVKTCYIMLKLLDDNGYQNWVTDVKNLLFMNGFGYVWENLTENTLLHVMKES